MKNRRDFLSLRFFVAAFCCSLFPKRVLKLVFMSSSEK